MTDDLARLSRADLEAEVRQLRAERRAAAAAGRRPPGRSTPAGADVLFSAVERTGMPMIVTDPNQPDDPIVFANRAFQDLSGYEADEILGRNCRFLQGPETEPDRLETLREAITESRDVSVELTNYRKDGTAFVNNLFVGPIFDADGRLLYHFGSQLDVTEACLNRKRLAESEERQRAIFNSASEMAIIVTDTEGLVTDWNTGAKRILGWSVDDMRGQNIERIFTPEDRAIGRAREEMEGVLRDGHAEDVRWHLRKDGSRFFAVGDMTALRGADGTHWGFVKAMSDRTAERHVTTQQEADAEFMRSVLASSADCIKVLDLDGGLTFMSEGGMRVMEVSDFNDVKGCPWPDFWQGRGHTEAVAALETAKAGGVGHFQGTADTYRGTPKWWDVQVTPILDAKGRPKKILSISRDITHQKTFENRLAASEGRWRGLFEGMQEGFFLGELVRDTAGRATDYRFIEINPAFARQSGLPLDSTGRTIRSFVPDIEQGLIDTYARVVETGEPTRFEISIPGLNRSFEARANREQGERFSCMFLDITERRQAEARRAAMVELGDRLRDVSDKAEISRIAAEVMGQALGLSHAGYGQVDPETETILVAEEWTAPGLTSIAGLHHFRTYGSYIEDLKAGRDVTIDDVCRDSRTAGDAEALKAISTRAVLNLPVLEQGRFVALFYALRAEAGAWSQEDIGFVRNVVDRIRAAIARIEAEEQQRVLNLELSHRLKNTLAMVQSIASQTLRNAGDMDEAREVLANRLIALGKAHDILLSGRSDSASLGAVIDGGLALHRDAEVRFRTSGPDLPIGPSAALSLSLILNELATNATKYGALSRPAGYVVLDWGIDGDGAEARFRLTWQEHGGPPVVQPRRKGFGSRLVQRGLAGGTVDLRYAAEGVVCTLNTKLSDLKAEM